MPIRHYEGLTVNERLFVSGLLEQFHVAARLGNRKTMISLLQQVSLPEQYAAHWVDTLLGDQNFFYY